MGLNYESIMIGQQVSEHDEVNNAKRVLSPTLAIRMDDVSTANVTYIGKAEKGSATSAGVWQVQKIDESGTPETMVITWADGNDAFDNIWANRTSLTYA